MKKITYEGIKYNIDEPARGILGVGRGGIRDLAAVIAVNIKYANSPHGEDYITVSGASQCL